VSDDSEMIEVGERVNPEDPGAPHTRARIAARIPSVRVVTYNIHTCVGVDRRYDPGRISTVLREIDADIACLQEVDARRRSERHADQWAYLGAATGCRVVTGTGIRQPRGRFGNAILTRFPVLAARLIDLTVAGCEPRGAIDADVLIGERVLRVIATHFGLHAAERRQQANRLMAALVEPVPSTRCDPLARSTSRTECGRANVPIMDAGAGARQDLCGRTGDTARCWRLSFPARPPCVRSPAARRQFVLECARSAGSRAAPGVAAPRQNASQ